MPTVHHRYLTVDGHRLFYREAGDPNAPALVLLHGFPTSSYMFRELVPALADRYHVIAPDHLGFGLSDAPSVEQFDYTFDALTALTQGLLRALKVDRYAIYVQDYGAPIGWRLALNDPTRSRRSSARAVTPTTRDLWKASGRSSRPIRLSRRPRPKAR